MNNSAPAASDRFINLIEAVAADRGASDPSIYSLGPSVGHDFAPAPASVTALGPSVGDDGQESDIRLKHDMRCVGTTVFGLPLYRFKYIGRPETYEGVMAHEVSQVMPAAVSTGSDGFQRVSYRLLGTSMRQVQ